ncbi:MAG TPA: universal stress protein [Lentimicrobium sp.]|nr:universal stress protein [Lentimicrobium sp.]
METTIENIKTIARFPNNRALLLQARLQADGIDCFLSHQNLLQAAVSMGVEIKVRESDMERALRMIELYRKDWGKEKEKSVKSLKNVRRILVPVDFSHSSSIALKLAIELADMLKAELKLLHVYFNPVMDATLYDASHSYQINLTNYLHEIEQSARKQMADLVLDVKAQASKRKNKIKITHSMVNGLAADEILAVAKKYHPGLILMGSKGMGMQSEGMMGSVTLKVASKSSIPVIALPENSKLIPVRKLRNIMYATDFDNYDEVALSKLINLVHPLNVTIHCVHISIGKVKPWEKIKMEALKDFISREYGEIPFKTKILVCDTILNGMESYMRDNPVDVMAITNHSRGMLDSLFTPNVTKMIMQRINKPLFIFKAGEDL